MHVPSARMGVDLDCPSSQPTEKGARIFGVIAADAGAPSVAYLEEAVPLDPALLQRTAPLDPTQVLRLAAPCATHECPHFASERCSLAEKIAAVLPPSIDRIAPCPIRKTCRWFAQEGVGICLRCAGIVTAIDRPSAEMRFVSNPHTRLRHLPIVRA
jgi:hypothetical protein